MPSHSRCRWCGDAFEVELTEVWGHDFQIGTCCETVYEEVLAQLQDGPGAALELLRSLEAEDLLGRRLRRVADTGLHLVLDYALDIRPVAFTEACRFILLHHTHNKPPPGWRFGAAVWNGPTMLGVVVCGNPVGHWRDSRSILEVTRLCLDRDLPDTLRWKAASTLYAWAATEATRRGYRRIVTYTRVDETGMSLRYARWRPVARIRGRSWNTPSRPRQDQHEIVDRIRWEKALSPARHSHPTTHKDSPHGKTT